MESHICPGATKNWYNCNLCEDNHWETCVDNAIILTHKTSYNQLSKIPKEENENVYEIIDLKSEIIDKFNILYDFNKISDFINISNLTIQNYNIKDIGKDIDNCEIFFSKKIAKFQKLSRVIFTDSYKNKLYITEGSASTFYIYNDKMLIILRFDENNKVYPVPNIPSNIKYLNIISENNHDLTNLPETIEHLNLSYKYTKIKDIKQSNLPMNLKTLNITIYDVLNDTKNVKISNGPHKKFKNIITKTCKVPFDCQLTVEFLNFDQ